MPYADLRISLICMSPRNPQAPDVPAEIRAEMARRGWSLRDLSATTGIKVPTLSRRLNGDDNLTFPELIAIASAFGIAPSALVARAEAVAA